MLISTSAPEDNLRRLLVARGFFLVAACTALGYAYWQLQLPLAYASAGWIIAGLTLISLVSILQIHLSRALSEAIFFSQLLIDVFGLTGLLFFTGGADNPFVSYYLVPLCLAAATLRRRYIWTLMLVSLCLYTTLFFWRVPLPDLAPQAHAHHSSDSGFSQHTVGMWITFLISALIIGYFVSTMAQALRRQDADLAQLREGMLRDEQLVAVATLAAGTAHELATPLTTMKALLGEMQADYDSPVALQDDIATLQQQINVCSKTLQQLNTKAQTTANDSGNCEKLQTTFQELIDDWLLLRPEVDAEISFDQQAPNISAQLHPTIKQSIANLLNNAADAQPTGIEVDISWDPSQITLSVVDKGPGFDTSVAQKIGQDFVSTKGQGRGIGLYLTNATVKRYGGELTIDSSPGEGTSVKLFLPIQGGYLE